MAIGDRSSEFKLYPVERHWWSFADHRAVLSVTRRIQARSVLEFGPGSSTLALIEGGATRIDCCEDNDHWLDVYRERLQKRFPDVVRIHKYTASLPLTIPDVELRRYDLALIDGPHQDHRPAVLDYCCDRCEIVLMPTEDHSPKLEGLRPAIAKIASRRNRPVEWLETGPLSGGFALIWPPAC